MRRNHRPGPPAQGKLNASSGAISLPSLNSSAGSAITAEQLLVWLESVNTFTELERIVTAFAGSSSSWGSRHLALAISKVPQVTVPGGSSNGGSSSAAERQLQLVEQLAGSLGPALGQLSVQEISRVSWALAQVRGLWAVRPHSRHMNAAARMHGPLAASLAGTVLSRHAWGALCAVHASVRGGTLTHHAASPALTPLCLPPCLQVGYSRDPSLPQRLAAAFFPKLFGRKQHAVPQAVVTLAVGLAGLGWADVEGWQRLREAGMKLLARMDARGVAQLVWAFSTARQQVRRRAGEGGGTRLLATAAVLMPGARGLICWTARTALHCPFISHPNAPPRPLAPPLPRNRMRACVLQLRRCCAGASRSWSQKRSWQW